VVGSIWRRGDPSLLYPPAPQEVTLIVSGLSDFSDVYLCLYHGSIAHRVGISYSRGTRLYHLAADHSRIKRRLKRAREVGVGFKLVIGQGILNEQSGCIGACPLTTLVPMVHAS